MVATPSNIRIPFPSPNEQPNWLTVPNLNAPLMDPISGTVGIPWYQFFNFLATRSSYVNVLSSDTTALQSSVSTLQTQVGELETDVTTLENQVAALQGQVATLQGQVATLQAQMAVLQSQVATLQSQMIHMLTKTNNAAFIFGTSQTVTAPATMAGLGITLTSLAPLINTRGIFSFDANVSITAAASAGVALRFGSGSPPAAGSPLTGTAVSTSTTITANSLVSLSLSGLITGLVSGTQYWLDLAISSITAGATLTINSPAATVTGLIPPN